MGLNWDCIPLVPPTTGKLLEIIAMVRKVHRDHIGAMAVCALEAARFRGSGHRDPSCILIIWEPLIVAYLSISRPSMLWNAILIVIPVNALFLPLIGGS